MKRLRRWLEAVTASLCLPTRRSAAMAAADALACAGGLSPSPTPLT